MTDRTRATDVAAAAGVLVLGVALCLVRGRVGLMPLDQSIVFDGGWRLLSGQVPYRDFSTPAGLVPAALQAAAFAAFGVSWLVYVAHAAVVNGLFGVASYVLLRTYGSPAWAAAVYGALGTVVFYPPFGVPFPDQHAFFFSLAAVLAARLAAITTGRSSTAWAAAVPVLALLAVLGKVIPSVFFLPIAAVLLARAGRRTVLVAALAGLVAVAVVAGVAFVAGVQGGLAVEALWTLPRAEGAARAAALGPGAVLEVLRRWSLPALLALPLVALRVRERASAEPLLLGAALVGASLLFALLTNNEPENAAACLFAAVGLADAARRASAGGWFPAVVVAVALVDGVRFDQRVNAPRLVHGLAAEPTLDARADLPAELAYLRWRLHFHYAYTPADLGRLAAWLRAQPEAFLLVGDSSFLYAITAKPSASPVLWFHRRLTAPARGSAAFDAFEARLVAVLRRHHVRYVVLEGRETYDGVRVGRLPALDRLVAAGRPVQSFGPFSVVEITP